MTDAPCGRRNGVMRSHGETLDAALEADGLFREVARAAARPAGTYVYGEYVLEALAGLEPGGLLAATAADARGLAEDLCRATGGTVISPGGRPGVFNLVLPGGRNLTAVALDRDIGTHLSGSGFTVQAMAIDAASSPPREIIDPLGGLRDLESGLLRAAAPGVFSDDPARLLAAVRLCDRYGLEPEEGTLSLMRAGAPLACEADRSRAWRIVAGLFAGKGLSGKARLLERSGVMAGLFPEVAATFGVPQNHYHHLGVWGHTLETLDLLERMLEEPGRLFPAFDDQIRAHMRRGVEGGVCRRAYLGFAALIHDIGKPSSMSVEPSGRIRFQGHQRRGAALARGIAGRMGLGRGGAAHLEGIVADHMRLGFLLEEGESAETRLRAIRELGNRCVEVVMLSLADRMATRGEASTERAMKSFGRMASRVMRDYFWDRDCPPLVSGGDVLTHAGAGPGPGVARALFSVRVAQREAVVTNRRHALEFLVKIGAGQ